jgi:hypothetical protein
MQYKFFLKNSHVSPLLYSNRRQFRFVRELKKALNSPRGLRTSKNLIFMPLIHHIVTACLLRSNEYPPPLTPLEYHLNKALVKL